MLQLGREGESLHSDVCELKRPVVQRQVVSATQFCCCCFFKDVSDPVCECTQEGSPSFIQDG